MDNLESIVKSARRKREDIVSGDIAGKCIENADFLSRYIEEDTNYSARVIKGAVDYKKEPTPESYKEAKRDGTLHHWVIVDDDIHCDIHREVREYTDSRMGDILVSCEKPDCYIIF
jgi:tRNA G37 N-methylase Trm5